VIPHGSATVLVTGETGTGKELLARAIHYNGPRRSQPFVEINCSAIPATLLEAELFGFEAGAFTDARAAKPGLFEAAHGGTLFLDEIGDLPVDLQAKLLKVLDGMEIRRLGSVRPVRVDVRVIAATHADLASAVRQGRFREDLFYRLHVVPIHLPALRDRGEDVLLLAMHFLAEFCAAYGVTRPVLNGDARGVLLRHTWPGNVRELRNSIERAVLLGSGNIEPSDLLDNSGLQVPSAIPFPATMDQIEQMAARVMVERLGGNKSAAAEALGISRSRLYRLLDHEP
jgi:transcriptional regulator with PAS, ATPase and Fis domain